MKTRCVRGLGQCWRGGIDHDDFLLKEERINARFGVSK